MAHPDVPESNSNLRLFEHDSLLSAVLGPLGFIGILPSRNCRGFERLDRIDRARQGKVDGERYASSSNPALPLYLGDSLVNHLVVFSGCHPYVRALGLGHQADHQGGRHNRLNACRDLIGRVSLFGLESPDVSFCVGATDGLLHFLLDPLLFTGAACRGNQKTSCQ